MAHDVFISYSSKDKVVADAVCATLEGRGIRCWIAPRDILPGSDWAPSIIDAINASALMLLVFSANANSSNQITKEVERAVHKGIPMVPLRIEAVEPSKSLEYFISTPHWLDAMTRPLELHLSRVADTVQLLLARGRGETITDSVPRSVSDAPVIPVAPPRPGRGLLWGALAAVGIIGIGLAWHWMGNSGAGKSSRDSTAAVERSSPALPSTAPTTARVGPELPPAVRAHYTQGADALARGDSETAITEFTATIVGQPDYAPAYVGRAAAHLHKMRPIDFDDAKIDADKAINLDPQLAMGFAVRAMIYVMESEKSSERVVADAMTAIHLDPRCDLAYAARAVAMGQQNDYPGARADAEKAVALNSESTWSWLASGFAAAMEKEPTKSLEAFTTAIRLDPGWSVGRSLRAIVEAQTANLEGAAADASEAIRLNPEDGYGYIARAYVEALRQDSDAAERDADMAIRLRPKDAFPHSVRAMALVARGDMDGAGKAAEDALKLDDRDRVALYVSSMAALSRGQLADAIRIAGVDIQAHPRDALAYLARATALGRNGKYDDALTDADAALRLMPGAPLVLGARADIYRAKGDLDSALSDADGAIKGSPDANNYRIRGVIYMLRKDYNHAIADLSESIRLSPPNSIGWWRRGEVLYMQGKYAEAIADYTAAISRDPGNANYFSDRALAEAKSGQADKAASDASAAQAVLRQHQRAALPAATPEGYAIHRKFDAQQNVIEEWYEDDHGRRVRSPAFKNSAGLRAEYDDKGRLTRFVFLDEAGAPLIGSAGYAEIRTTYNADGEPSSTYYDVQGRQMQTQVCIKRVMPNQQAMRLGLREGDVVVSYNGHEIHEVGELRRWTVGDDPPIREMKVLRDGEPVVVMAAPGKLGIESEIRIVPSTGPSTVPSTSPATESSTPSTRPAMQTK